MQTAIYKIWTRVTGICRAPYVFASIEHSLFFIMGTRRRTAAHTRPAVPKMAWTSSVFPSKEGFQVPSNKPRPSGEGYSLGDVSVLARMTWISASRNLCKTTSTYYHRNLDTPDLIRVAGNTVDRSTSMSQPSGLGCNSIQSPRITDSISYDDNYYTAGAFSSAF